MAMLMVSCVSHAAYASIKVEQDHSLPKTRFQQKPVYSESAPVLLEAEQVHYDQTGSVATASGKVEVIQGETILLADRLVYDAQNNQVKAAGNVSLLEPNGNVYFADEVELKDDLKAGVVHQFKARLADNSLFAAQMARKLDENKTELFKAVYSPCSIACSEDGSASTPLWQLKADHVLIDQDAQTVKYNNAQFALGGVPVLYTPYFSHPTPGADNQSGLLTPTFFHSDNIGSVYKQPIYYVIAQDKDITLTPIYTSDEGLVMAGEYRQHFNAGMLNIDGSITRATKRDALGNELTGNELRGHINGEGLFRIDDRTNWGFNVHRTTDDTYLRLYNFSNETLLTSRAYGEHFGFGNSDRSYAVIQGLTFQGLTAQDDSRKIPVVLPLIDVTWQSEPGWNNSRFTLAGNSMVLFRDIGSQSRRLSTTANWNLPYISDDGQIIEFDARMRTDIYDVSDVALSNGRNFDGVTGRAVPEASITWHYPFISQNESTSLMLEPVVQLVVSPTGGNSEKIPNEDSLVPEFTDSNLFSANRFAGLDRIESGPRASYGVRGQAQFSDDKFVEFLFGQHYRYNNDINFPFSNDSTSHFSDYVGRIGVNVEPFSIAYRFRLDKDEFSPKRSEVDGGFNFYPLRVYATYLSLKNDPILASKEIISGTTSLNLTQNWSWDLVGTHDLLLDQTGTLSSGLTFKNECANFTTMVGRDYTRDRDIKPSTTYLFRISLKNLE